MVDSSCVVSQAFVGYQSRKLLSPMLLSNTSCLNYALGFLNKILKYGWGSCQVSDFLNALFILWDWGTWIQGWVCECMQGAGLLIGCVLGLVWSVTRTCWLGLQDHNCVSKKNASAAEAGSSKHGGQVLYRVQSVSTARRREGPWMRCAGLFSTRTPRTHLPSVTVPT